MKDVFLQAKFVPPAARKSLVRRSRIADQIAEVSDDGWFARKLTLISAPAGYGKTTLLTQWLAETSHPVAWVSLDQRDADVMRFWSCIARAVESVFPGTMQAAAALSEPINLMAGGIASEEYQIQLLNGLQGREQPLCLVLEDFHLTANAEICSGISFFIEHLPASVHLIIVSRIDPPLNLFRLRARDQVREIRQGDLSFTAVETAEFLQLGTDAAIPEGELVQICRQTEGWAAALQIEALLRGGLGTKRAPQYDDRQGTRFIMDFFKAEIWEQLPAEQRSFLMQVSILEYLHPALCRAVTGDPASEEFLHALNDQNLFISVHGDQGWFKLHQLFRDFLGDQLRKQCSEEDIRQRHRLASQWLEQNGLAVEAIRHSTAGDDTADALRILDRHAHEIFVGGHRSLIQESMQTISEETIGSYPTLSVYYAFTLFLSGQAANLDQLLHTLSDQGTHWHRAVRAILRSSFCVQQGKGSEAVSLSQQALELLPEDSAWRGLALLTLANAYSVKNQLRLASEAYGRAMELGRDTAMPFVQFTAGSKLVLNHYYEGRLQEAARIGHQLAALAKEKGYHRSDRIAYLYSALAMVYTAWHQLDKARDLFREAEHILKQCGSTVVLAYCYLCRAEMLEAADDLAEIERTLEQVEALTLQYAMPPWVKEFLLAWSTRIRMEERESPQWLEGAFEELEASAKRLGDIDHRLHIMTQARLLRKLGRAAEGAALLDNALVRWQKQGRKDLIMEAFVHRAILRRELGQHQEALADMERALGMAEAEGYRSLFLAYKPDVGALLLQARDAGILPAYCRKLLDAVGEGRDNSPPVGEAVKAGSVETLNPREVEILELMAKGLTNKDIANRLFLTVSTVKWHSSNIYGKLQVHNRTTAVAAARSLGLLADE